MFSPATLAFLSDLKAHNERAWFEANRARYEADVAAPARAFCDALCERLAVQAGGPVGAKLFRIHRDLRFSRDKTPYTTHVHMSFSDGAPGAWLVGLEPGALVLGYGSFGFDDLDRWRAAVDGARGSALAAVLDELQARGLRLDPPELKRVPAPYDAAHPRGALLRRKSLALWCDGLPVDTAFGPGAPARIAEALADFAPLRTWMRGAL